MRQLSIATRLYALVGLSLTFSLGLIFFLLYQTARVSDRYETLLATEVNQEGRACKMAVDFKTQVQEWKNILLRGQDPHDLEKYRRSFFEHENRVREGARELRRAVADPGVTAALDDFLK